MKYSKSLLLISLALVMSLMFVASGMAIHQVNAASPEPPEDTGSAIPMDFDNWLKVNTGNWQQTADGIKVYGAGIREGHQGLASKETFNFLGTETRIKWRGSGGDEPYSAFWVLLASDYVPESGASSSVLRGGYFTTDHSWNESTVIGAGTWYYTRIVVGSDGQYTATTSRGAYDDAGGAVIYTGSGEYENADRGKVVVIFNDNYGGTSTYVEVAEVIIEVDSDLKINIETSAKQYQQGEAVVLSGQLIYKGEPVQIGKEKEDIKGTIILDIGVPFPNSEALIHGQLTIRETNEAGEFSVMPFAGYNLGEYTLQVKAGFKDEQTDEQIKGESEEITLQVVKATPVSLGWSRPPLEQIEKLYRDRVPDGPVRTIVMAQARTGSFETSGKWKQLGEAMEINAVMSGIPAESNFGSENNILSSRFPELGNFACGGYQAQVLRFFASVQFDPDPDVRALMSGLDYGPIARGFYIIGGHHAVSLHPIGVSWDNLSEIRRVAVAFDPWPKQTPEIYSMEEFEWPWGGLKIDPYALENTEKNKIFTGYPMTGAGIYTNPFFSQVSSAPEPAMEKSSLAVNCPVNVLVTDANGKRLGILPDGTVVQEFAANIYRAVDNGETQGWYIGLNQGSYILDITGTATGTFHLQVSGDLADGELLNYGEQPISLGDQASIKLDDDEPGAILTLPDGTEVTPTALDIGGSMSRLLLIGIAVGSLLVAIGLAVLLKFMPRKARLIIFFVVLIGGLIGGILGSGHNFSEVIALIRAWSLQ